VVFRSGGRLIRAVQLAVLSVPLLLIYLHASRAAEQRAAGEQHVPLQAPKPPYVSSKACRSCHAAQYESWYASYHRSMTQPATPQTVRGDFAGQTLTHGQERVVLERQGDAFWLDVLAPDSSIAQDQLLGPLPQGRHPVKLVTGSHHMQVYWYESGRGRALGQVPFAFLHEDARWVPRHMVFMRPPSLMRLAETGRWNASCLHCHSTGPEPHLALDGQHDTRVAELGVACEACHGPGGEHVRQMSSPVARYASHLTRSGQLQIVNPAKLSAERAAVVCSQCHASWQPLPEHYAARDQTGSAYRPGDDPSRTQWLFAPARKDTDPRVSAAMMQDRSYAPGQFWSDGQARVSGREYHGMSESACAKGGELSCSSCHTMHRAADDPRSLKEWADDQLAADKGNEHGDAACTGCHADIARAPAQHTQHADESPGSRCYNCHMPHTSWGLLKAMRSHRISSPSVQETLDTGRPNACTLCHLDRSLRWTARMLDARFGVEPPADGALAPAEHGLAAGVSLALLGDAGQRGLIAAALRRPEAQRTAGTAWMPALLGVLMDDPYDAVRYAAGHALRSLPGVEPYAYDFVLRPHQRPAVADDVARRAAADVARARQAGQLSRELPFTADGVLSEEARSLLPRRDQRPVHLLE